MPAPIHPTVAELLARLARTVDAGKPTDISKDAHKLVDAVRAIDLRDADAVTATYLLAGALDVERSLRSAAGSALLRGGVETIRQALERLEEQEALADARPLADVVDWTRKSLNITQERLADLIKVDSRTVGRWLDRNAPADAAETEQMQRARRLARVVRQLRHVLTATGTLSWLQEPHEDLMDRPPLDLICESDKYEDFVLQLASRGRSQVAS